MFLFLIREILEAFAQRCSVKKVFLEILQRSQENTCARVCNFIKEETLAQVFSCEFCEISNNFFFYRTPRMAASKFNHFKETIKNFQRIFERHSTESGFWDVFEEMIFTVTLSFLL